MEIFIIILLVLIMVLLLYGVANLIQKIEYYEEFIISRREKYIQLYKTIKELDSKELFEKDDDVGTVFTQIKDEIEAFENIIE